LTLLANNFITEESEAEKLEQLINQYKWTLDDSEQTTIQEKEVETDATLETKSESGEPKPEAQKPVSQFKFKGLGNMGNTCYMNSFLQALFMTPEFRS